MKKPRYPTLRLAMIVTGLASALACGPGVPTIPGVGPEVIGNPIPDDFDDDGFLFEDGDCNDEDANVNPDAAEICSDGIDNDCDGDIDEADSECVVDNDGDGFVAAKDCDDDDANVHPNAVEVCDGIDNNCSGVIDDVEDVNGCVQDVDFDGDGYVASEDCDDEDAAVNPGAIEQCEDGIDNNCNGDFDWDDVECSFIGNG